MPAKRLRILILLAAFCYCVLYQIHRSEPVSYVRLNNLYHDTIARTGRLVPENPNVVFLAIDADSVSLDPATDAPEMYGIEDPQSVEARAFAAMMQRYPWPRAAYALILQRLVEAGAKVVLFDLTFPRETEGDEPFRLALERYRDHVVIGSNFVDPSWNGLSRIGASFSRPAETLIPATSPLDDRVAFTNFWPDLDDTVRRVLYRVTKEQVEFQNPRPDTERFLSLAARAATKAGFDQSIPPDLAPRLIRFTGPPGQGFAPHSVFEIFVPDYWDHNYRQGQFFRDKIVLVGAHGAWQHDEHQTPFGSMPGPELHLNSLNALIHHEFIREMPAGAEDLLMVFAAVAAVGLSVFLRSPWLRLLSLGIADLLAAWAALFAYNHASIYIPLICPLAELNVTLFLGLVTDFTLERMEKNRVRRALERYVSRDVVVEMLDNPESYRQSLGGVIKPVTILFSDIRGYSVVSAHSDPHTLVTQLNEYLSAMVACVFQFGGTLDKFIGDAVMAVWGNLRSNGTAHDAVNAVNAALAMQKELAALNEKWRSSNLPALRAGIAIHHGKVVVGNIGSPQRMEFTVIGDAVNVSWRLQELTKEIGCDFIVSDEVRALVAEHFNLRSMGTVNIPGVDPPREIFTVCDSVEREVRDNVSHPAVSAPAYAESVP